MTYEDIQNCSHSRKTLLQKVHWNRNAGYFHCPDCRATFFHADTGKPAKEEQTYPRLQKAVMVVKCS